MMEQLNTFPGKFVLADMPDDTTLSIYAGLHINQVLFAL